MEDRLVKQIKKLVADEVRRLQFVMGVWVSSEPVDANLSVVSIDGYEFRWIPKLSHVTGLVEGSTVLMKPNPLTIIGIQVGDITLAEI